MAYDVQPCKGYDPGQNPFYITLQRAVWRRSASICLPTV